MADVAVLPDLTPVPLPVQPLSSQEQNLFRSEVFGFKRDEVLNCIQNLARENKARQQELDDTVLKMQMELHKVREEKQALEQQLAEKTQELRTCAQEESEHLQQAADQLKLLQSELEHAAQSLTECQNALAEKEKVLATLKTENLRLNSMVNSLTVSLSNCEPQKLPAEPDFSKEIESVNAQMEQTRREMGDLRLQAQQSAEQQAREITENARKSAWAVEAQATANAQEAVRRMTAHAAELEEQAREKAAQLIIKATEQAQAIATQAQQQADEIAKQAQGKAQLIEQQARNHAKAVREAAAKQADALKLQAADQAIEITAQASERAQALQQHTRSVVEESSRSIGRSILELKQQLAEVDEKILRAGDSLQQATNCISGAMTRAEKDLVTLDDQVKNFGYLLPVPQPDTPFAQRQPKTVQPSVPTGAPMGIYAPPEAYHPMPLQDTCFESEQAMKNTHRELVQARRVPRTKNL